MPTDAMELADRLKSLTEVGWVGGAVMPGTDITWELVSDITTLRGTWAALLEPLGLGPIGHWVVIDGISDDGLVLVRDPVGDAYGIPLADFALLWGYTILVAQEASR